MPHYLSHNKCLRVVGTCSLAGQAIVPHYLSLNKCLWAVGTCSLDGHAVVPHYLSLNKCLWAVGTCSLAGQAVVPHCLSLNKCLRVVHCYNYQNWQGKGPQVPRVPFYGSGAPKVVSAVGVVEVELGNRAELHCEASGVPLPNPMEWSFKGESSA